jgi:hypothetical protein
MPLSYGISLQRLTPIKMKIYEENMPICVSIFFFKFGIKRDYDLILSHLNFRTLYCRRHFDALFLVNAFKGKTNCHSIMDTVGIRVPTRHIREFSTSAWPVH